MLSIGDHVVSSASGEVTLSLESPSQTATLSGIASVSLRNGVAVFDHLFVDELGGDYRLRATALDTLSTKQTHQINQRCKVFVRERRSVQYLRRFDRGGSTLLGGLTPFIERSAGDSSPTNNPSVPTPLMTDEALVFVSTMDDYACGLSEQGALFCWGYGTLRQDGADFPNLCPEEYGSLCRCSLKPFPLFTDLTFSQISTRSHRACGLSPSGMALCWGQVWV